MKLKNKIADMWFRHFPVLSKFEIHGRTQPKIAGGGQSKVQKGTLLMMMIWHQKKGTCSQKRDFFLPCPLLGTALKYVQIASADLGRGTTYELWPQRLPLNSMAEAQSSHHA